MKFTSEGPGTPALQRYGERCKPLEVNRNEHEDKEPKVWKIRNLATSAQAHNGSALFGLVESIRAR